MEENINIYIVGNPSSGKSSLLDSLYFRYCIYMDSELISIGHKNPKKIYKFPSCNGTLTIQLLDYFDHNHNINSDIVIYISKCNDFNYKSFKSIVNKTYDNEYIIINKLKESDIINEELLPNTYVLSTYHTLLWQISDCHSPLHLGDKFRQLYKVTKLFIYNKINPSQGSWSPDEIICSSYNIPNCIQWNNFTENIDKLIKPRNYTIDDLLQLLNKDTNIDTLFRIIYLWPHISRNNDDDMYNTAVKILIKYPIAEYYNIFEYLPYYLTSRIITAIFDLTFDNNKFKSLYELQCIIVMNEDCELWMYRQILSRPEAWDPNYTIKYKNIYGNEIIIKSNLNKSEGSIFLNKDIGFIAHRCQSIKMIKPLVNMALITYKGLVYIRDKLQTAGVDNKNNNREIYKKLYHLTHCLDIYCENMDIKNIYARLKYLLFT